MQKVITTKTTIAYVEDAYTDPESPFFSEDELNFTQTLTNYECRLEQGSMGLEDMACVLEALTAHVAKTSGISEDDRKSITSALDNASSSVAGLQEECDRALFDVSAALRAFDGLQVQECIEVQE